MKIHFDLIIIGNELLNGKTLDLNTSYIAKKLYNEGHNLRKVHMIGDRKDLFNQALDDSIKHAQYVITTGGLGPTEDDLTKSMLSDYFKKNIVFNQMALDIVKVHYDRHNIPYNQERIQYHKLPLEFTPLHNPVGFAPGIMFYDEKSQCKIFSTPGVPKEFQSMVSDIILKEHVQRSKLFQKHLTIKTWKISEAYIFHKLVPEIWKKLSVFGELSSLPYPMGVNIGIDLNATSLAKLIQKEKDALEVVNSSELKDHIWHIGNESLEEVIITKAKEKNITFGFAESCTGGLVASRITDISGCSSVFWGSIISYANEVKMNCLQVSPETLQNYGAVSEQTALEMAIGARKNLQVDIVITTTGIAGPGGATESKPVGTIGIGVSSAKTQASELYYFTGNRKSLKQTFSEAALVKLLEEIILF